MFHVATLPITATSRQMGATRRLRTYDPAARAPHRLQRVRRGDGCLFRKKDFSLISKGQFADHASGTGVCTRLTFMPGAVLRMMLNDRVVPVSFTSNPQYSPLTSSWPLKAKEGCASTLASKQVGDQARCGTPTASELETGGMTI